MFLFGANQSLAWLGMVVSLIPYALGSNEQWNFLDNPHKTQYFCLNTLIRVHCPHLHSPVMFMGTEDPYTAPDKNDNEDISTSGTRGARGTTGTALNCFSVTPA